MYRYKLTATWLRSLLFSYDLLDPNVDEIATIRPLNEAPNGAVELIGNTLVVTKSDNDCVLDIRPGDTVREGLYIPHHGHAQVRTQMKDSYNVLEWRPISFSRIPIVKGYIIKIAPDKVTCSVQNVRKGTYALREFTSSRALCRTTLESVIPYWMWKWSSNEGMKDYARKQLEEGFEVDDTGTPKIEYSLEESEDTKSAILRILERLEMPLTLPFRCAAANELVYQGVKLWDNIEYRDWLRQHPKVKVRSAFGYNEESDCKVLVYTYKIQDISEERIQNALQFNDVYWTEGKDDESEELEESEEAEELENEETEEQETGETDE